MHIQSISNKTECILAYVAIEEVNDFVCFLFLKRTLKKFIHCNALQFTFALLFSIVLSMKSGERDICIFRLQNGIDFCCF